MIRIIKEPILERGRGKNSSKLERGWRIAKPLAYEKSFAIIVLKNSTIATTMKIRKIKEIKFMDSTVWIASPEIFFKNSDTTLCLFGN